VDWLPYQLEPALALCSGQVHRVLVADHVGLGKTVEAGIALAMLGARGLASRVLCVVPAGLRGQWQQELRDRFAIEATWCDAAWLALRVAELPAGTNPWALPGVYLASHDYVKRADVLSGFEATTWDLLVVDEAHAAAPANERSEAIGGLACRAMRVLLLSATPHDGDDAKFDRLCALGQLGHADRIAVFRRTRRDVGLPDAHRRCVLAVIASPAEHHVHSLLERYRRAVERETGQAARLAMLVLAKRALSGPFALWRSVARRLDVLGTVSAADPQLALPFPIDLATEGDDLPDHVLAIPGLSDARRERAWLNALAHASRSAVTTDSKLAALERLVRRAREPLLVFTEYRDTLVHVGRRLGRITSVAVLHGAQTADERSGALRAFEGGRARVLLSTDVAAQGLNLHRACRAVVTLELPWNPNRLEQRVGRVHRLGQTRRCHAVHLVGRDTEEQHLAARLGLRVGRIRHALGDGGTHLDALEGVFTPGPGDEASGPRLPDSRLLRLDFGGEARALAGIMKVVQTRRRPRRGAARERARRETAPLATSLRWRPGVDRAADSRLDHGVVLLHRHDLVSPAGLLLESRLTAIRLDLVPGWPGAPDARTLRAFFERALGEAATPLDAILRQQRDELLRRAHARAAASVASDAERLTRIRHHLRQRLARHFAQPGLFDEAAWRATVRDPNPGGVVWPAVAVAPATCESRLLFGLVVRPSGRHVGGSTT
jgi:superfamily II DNA or RNA helicase